MPKQSTAILEANNDDLEVPDQADDMNLDGDFDVDSINEVDELIKHGIASGDVKKLKDAGYLTVQQVKIHHPKFLAQIKGLSEAKIDKIIAASQGIVPSGFVSGSQVLHSQKGHNFIPTGSVHLNQILGGGIRSYQLTEIWGKSSSGKTQLCHTLAVTTQLPPPDGSTRRHTPGSVMWIDTEGSYSSERIVEIAKSYNTDESGILDNILYLRARNCYEQCEIVRSCDCASLIVEKQVKIIILDSISTLFRVDYSGRGELAERQQTLNAHLQDLQRLACIFNLAVFYTNVVMDNPAGGILMKDPTKPVGGNILSHACQTRLCMKIRSGETRLVKLTDSSDHPTAECFVEIGPAGIQNSDEN